MILNNRENILLYDIKICYGAITLIINIFNIRTIYFLLKKIIILQIPIRNADPEVENKKRIQEY